MISSHTSKALLLLTVALLFIIIEIFEPIGVFSHPSYEPKYPTGSRTAVMISGELRCGNISFNSPVLHVHDENHHHPRYKGKFSPTDSRTPIETILEYLLTPLALHGGVDLFIYISIPRDVPINQTAIELWDGNPLTFQAVPNDTRICKLYSNHPIFSTSTKNRVFCFTEFNRQLSNYFIRNSPGWRRYDHQDPHDIEALLQQEYGKYMANLGCKQYVAMSKVSYKYKVRLRFDEAMYQPLPSFNELNFQSYPVTNPKMLPCNNMKRLFFASFAHHGPSTEDSFNIGEADDMDKILDHYLWLISEPIIEDPDWDRWINEKNQILTLRIRHKLCLTEHRDIAIVKMRRRDIDPYVTRFEHKPQRYDSNWISMN